MVKQSIYSLLLLILLLLLLLLLLFIIIINLTVLTFFVGVCSDLIRFLRF